MTNDDTQLYGSQPLEQPQNPIEQPQNYDEQSQSGTWKRVAFGATTGILVGAGAMYAHHVLAANGDDDHDAATDNGATADAAEPVKVASTDGGLSFGDAFNAARAQVGPGGVFRWHGGLYSTYTKEEWDGMSDADKDAFAEAVRPEVRADQIAADRIAEQQAADLHAHHVETHPTGHGPHPAVHPAVDHHEPEPTPEPNPDTPQDVRIVGTGTVEGHQAAAFDLSGNGEADVVIIDVNDNGQVDDPDVAVFKDGTAATMGQIAQSVNESEGAAGTAASYTTAHTTDDTTPDDPTGVVDDPTGVADDPMLHQTAFTDNPDLSPDMPDYVDNAAGTDTMV